MHYLNVGPQAFHIPSWQREVVSFSQIQNRFEAHIAIQVAMQVHEG
jgi:hypothetical protein